MLDETGPPRAPEPRPRAVGPRMGLLAFVACVLALPVGCLLAIAAPGLLVSSVPFESTRWRDAGPYEARDSRTRRGMVREIERDLLLGTHRDDVRALLGPPDKEGGWTESAPSGGSGYVGWSREWPEGSWAYWLDSAGGFSLEDVGAPALDGVLALRLLPAD